MYKCVIFDLDGTLLNTLEDLADAGNYALKKLGFPAHAVDSYKYFVGNGIPKLIQRILPADSDASAYNKARDYFNKYYSLHSADKTRPYDGICSLLSLLKENGIKIGVATNKDHVFSQRLVKNYFDGKVEIVCGRRDDIPKKPDPYSVNYIIQRLEISPKDVLYVGDSSVDMETAANAGVDSCGVLWGFRTEEELLASGAVFIAENSRQLADLILRQHRTKTD